MQTNEVIQHADDRVEPTGHASIAPSLLRISMAFGSDTCLHSSGLLRSAMNCWQALMTIVFVPNFFNSNPGTNYLAVTEAA